MADERKKIFIDTVEALFARYSLREDEGIFIPQEAFDFFEDYKKSTGGAKAFTEKGIAVIKEMREVADWISAKALGERMDIAGRSVSGTMRKLVTDGYIEKRPGTPAAYRITDKGMNCEFPSETAEFDN